MSELSIYHNGRPWTKDELIDVLRHLLAKSAEPLNDPGIQHTYALLGELVYREAAMQRRPLSDAQVAAVSRLVEYCEASGLDPARLLADVTARLDQWRTKPHA